MPLKSQQFYKAIMKLYYHCYVYFLYQSIKKPFIKSLDISQNPQQNAPLLARKFTCGP